MTGGEDHWYFCSLKVVLESCPWIIKVEWCCYIGNRRIWWSNLIQPITGRLAIATFPGGAWNTLLPMRTWGMKYIVTYECIVTYAYMRHEIHCYLWVRGTQHVWFCIVFSFWDCSLHGAWAGESHRSLGENLVWWVVTMRTWHTLCLYCPSCLSKAETKHFWWILGEII